MVEPTRSSDAAASRPRPDFFSHPSEEELIARYLRPRVSEGKRCPFIHDADVYSLGPAELTNHFAPALAINGDRAWYFFSAVRAKSRVGQRKARAVDSGEGVWHSEAGARPVAVEPCRRLGHRQSFSFVAKVDGRRVRSGWLMVELGLDGTDEIVLCKMYLSPRAHLLTGGPAASRKRKAADDDKNPASTVRQRRVARPTEAAAPPQANGDTAGGEAEQKEAAAPPQANGDTAGGEAEQKEAAAPPQANDDTAGGEAELEDAIQTRDDDDAAGSVFTRLARVGEESRAMGYVDRPDEVIRAGYGLEEIDRCLDGAAKKREDFLSSCNTAGDTGCPALGDPASPSWEEPNSTEPLWFEGYKRGYSRLRLYRRC